MIYIFLFFFHLVLVLTFRCLNFIESGSCPYHIYRHTTKQSAHFPWKGISRLFGGQTFEMLAVTFPIARP